MKSLVAALTAAVALLCAGSASANVVLFEQSGTSSMAGSGSIILPGAGHYRAEITTSDIAFLVAVVEWDEHWDYFLAPPPRPHSEYIEGNDGTSSDSEAGYLKTLVFDIILTESYRFFNSGPIYELWGIPTGTPMYEWTRPLDIRLYLNFDNDDGAGPALDYTFKVTQISAVAEPSTWAVMILGFGLAGAALRRAKPALAQLRTS